MSEKLLNSTPEHSGGDDALREYRLEGSSKIDLSKLTETVSEESGIDDSVTNVESTDIHVSFCYAGYEFHGDKTLLRKKEESSDAWEIEFKRQDGDIDEMTGVGAFKTMRIILPAVNTMVRMIREKDPVSPIFFDTDERRLKLYSRAIGQIVKSSKQKSR